MAMSLTLVVEGPPSCKCCSWECLSHWLLSVLLAVCATHGKCLSHWLLSVLLAVCATHGECLSHWLLRVLLAVSAARGNVSHIGC